MAYASWEEELAAQNAEIAKLREQNLAAQGQVSSTPFFNGPAYDPSAASAGTGRGALSHRDGQMGYYGGGQWNSLGAMPAAGTPEFQKFVQQASWEGDKEAGMMAQQAKMPAPSPSYTHSAPPSWAQPQQTMMGGTAQPSPFRVQPYGASQPNGLLAGGAGGSGGVLGSMGGSNRSMGGMGFNPFGMNSFFSKYWGK